MLDCIRATRRQLPQQAQDIEDVVIAVETEPTARLRVRDAVRRLESRARPRVLECVDLLAQGHTQAEAPVAELHIRHMPGGRFTDHVFAKTAAHASQRIGMGLLLVPW